MNKLIQPHLVIRHDRVYWVNDATLTQQAETWVNWYEQVVKYPVRGREVLGKTIGDYQIYLETKAGRPISSSRDPFYYVGIDFYLVDSPAQSKWIQLLRRGQIVTPELYRAIVQLTKIAIPDLTAA